MPASLAAHLAAWIALGIASAAAVYAALKLLIEPLRRLAVAHPNHRSSHTSPTPQGAGLAVIPVFLVAGGLGMLFGLAPAPGGVLHSAATASAALGLMVIGLVDDMRTLPILPRIAAQLLAAVVVLATLPDGFRLVPFLPTAVERCLLGLLLVGFINLFNFMDGIDLISVTEVGGIAGGVFILAVCGLLPPAFGWYGAALLGAVLGFVPWNFPPARMFLGDAGSLSLGLLTAVMLLHVAAAGAWAAACILPLYYLADSGLTLARRMLAGKPFWQPHREHAYQRARQNGLTVMAVIARIATVNAALILLALAATAFPGLGPAVLAILAAGVIVLALLWNLQNGGRISAA